MKTLLLLPNQLFNLDILKSIEFNNIILYEHPKFFTEYVYHKSKLVFHRATMKTYYDFMKNRYTIKYLEYNDKFVIKNDIIMYDPTDFDIFSEIKNFTKKHKFNLEILDSPLFIFTLNDLENYMNSNKSRNYFNATFYKWARIEKNILMNGKNPIGGKWSFDTENRSTFEKTQTEPPIPKFTSKTRKDYIQEAIKYVNLIESGDITWSGCKPDYYTFEYQVDNKPSTVNTKFWYQNENGQHVVQRVPPTERDGRRHTSIVSVATLMLPPEKSLKPLPESEIEIEALSGRAGAGENRQPVV